MMPGEHRFDPLEITLCIVFAVSAVVQLVYGPSSQANAVMPAAARVAWLGMLIFGAVLVLFGVFSRRVFGWMIEIVGLLAFGLALIIWGLHSGVLIIRHVGFHPATATGPVLITCIGVAVLWKRHQLRQDLKRLKKVVAG